MGIFDRLWKTPKPPAQVERTEQAVPVAVPASVAEVAPARPVERRNRERRDARRGVKVVVIDDSATVVAVLRKMLRSAGYETRDAADAERGLALIAEFKPELIFLDIVLPGMNGFGALRALRKDASTQHIPVIMISGNEHATEQFYANRIGADDFLKKPFSRFEVFAHIEKLLDENDTPRRKGGLGAVRDASDAVPSTLAELGSSAGVAPAARVPAPTAELWLSALDARKELTAMGLQYFNYAHYFAAIRRADLLAVRLFVCSGGVVPEMEFEGETALRIAAGVGSGELLALLKIRPASAPTVPPISPGV